jgi:surfactin synthase thioesterase subunit
MKLICIPYAGGTKHAYRKLKPFLEKCISMCTLEIPGRGSRSWEDLISDLDLLGEDLYRQVKKLDLTDYVLFGHSMGAMLGDILLHKLKDNGEVLPSFFLVTGCPSPKRRSFRTKLSVLDDEEFKTALKKLGGMPENVLENKELVKYILPILRSDIEAIDQSVYINKGKYPVPVTAFAGTQEGLTEEDIATWQLETSSDFEFEFLSGDHFFINQHLKFLGDLINKKANALTNKTF